ncbi:hypothetical protein [Modestobacter lapidis]|nr:hypothetical protein [Modestobacter lapidis]
MRPYPRRRGGTPAGRADARTTTAVTGAAGRLGRTFRGDAAGYALVAGARTGVDFEEHPGGALTSPGPVL